MEITVRFESLEEFEKHMKHRLASVGSVTVEPTHLPEDSPAEPEAAAAAIPADSPVDPPAEAKAAARKAAMEKVAAIPTAVTLDMLRNTLSAINEKDKRNLVHVKTALTNHNVKKVTELAEDSYRAFYEAIKEYA